MFRKGVRSFMAYVINCYINNLYKFIKTLFPEAKMIKTDVLIIGGSAAGLVSAATVKSNNKDKSVT